MRPTLQRYIELRLDGVQGELPLLKKMFIKSFTRSNFRKFWTIWNPIFSYVLTYFVFKPIRNITSSGVAIFLTFLISGLFHDLFAWIILGKVQFATSMLFIIYAVLVLIETRLKITLPQNDYYRVAYNLGMLLLPFFVVVYIL